MSSDARYGFFYSNKCQFCRKLKAQIDSNEHVRSIIDVIDILTIPRNSMSHIRSVPSLQNSKTKQVYQGRKAFELVDSILQQNVPAFEYGVGGNQFSFVDNENSLSSNNKPFTFLTPDGFDMPDNVNQSQNNNESQRLSNSDLDQLIAQRNSEIPANLERI
tara:strand:+ start:656 stop:1138 length:483 start_codon:yes stop_codon:yes gene_type:complete